jgi:acyl-CoA thioesterase
MQTERQQHIEADIQRDPSARRLVAEAVEQHAAGPTALYAINIRDARTGDLVASSQDLVYRKKEWFVPEA